MAHKDTNPGIPLIDFAPFLSTTAPPTTRTTTAQHILSAFQTSGFLYLTNHGIPSPQISKAFTHSATFFAQPLGAKQNLAWDSPESNRGYSRMGQEKVTNLTTQHGVADLRASNPDLKESYEIGREGVPGHPNQWPVSDAGDLSAESFRADMKAFFDACKALHVTILRAIALALGIEEGWFDDYAVAGDNTLRLLHYPPVSRAVFRENKGQVRAGAHTDYGSLTLLFQDARGGLQVRKGPDGDEDGGEWVDARPIAGTIVVNAGDLLARWSNDVVKSTLHRVVEPPMGKEGEGEGEGEGEYPARYSIAYFCNPDFDKFIDVVPGTVGEGEVKRYEGVNSGEYLVRRLAATY